MTCMEIGTCCIVIYSDLKHRNIFTHFSKTFSCGINAVRAFKSHMLWTVKSGSGLGKEGGGEGGWRGLPEKSNDLKYDHFSKPLRRD